jgi:hypothetical protein
MILKRIEAFIAGLLATRAKIPLDSIGCLAVLMNLQISTHCAFLRLNNIAIVLLLSSTHSNLTPDHLT